MFVKARLLMPVCREWSPEEDSTMSLLQPVETALRNSRWRFFQKKTMKTTTSSKFAKVANGHLVQICKRWKRPPDPSLHRSAVGQFTISLTKVCGSLGFTLRQLDDTVLKHTIKVRLTLSYITTIKKNNSSTKWRTIIVIVQDKGNLEDRTCPRTEKHWISHGTHWVKVRCRLVA